MSDHKAISRRQFLTSTTMSLAGLAVVGNISAGTNDMVGKLAPELEVPYWIDKDGEPTTFNITSNKGKWVFLKCFQNWCPGCHKYGFPALKQVSDEFENHDGIAIAGIQTVFEGFFTNTQEVVRELQLRYKLRIPMGHDPGDPNGSYYPSTMQSYLTGGTPWMILIDPEGTVVYSHYHADPNKLIGFLHKNLA